jgi:fatty acid amide hydrolase 2
LRHSVDKRLLKSGLALSADVTARRVSSAQLTELAIARASHVNGDLNAIVATRYDAARLEAAAVDRANQGSADLQLRFRGVPCTIKEAIGVQGMPNASGFVPRKDYRVAQDATVVRRLRAHGIVVIGVTNTSELCMWQESYNKLYGATNNPHDTARTVGGSSGGEAAVVAAGVSPIGVGSDIGGSIRMPAFFCGVFGHKPTGGAVPNTGQFPIARNEALRYLTTGPITRHAEDLFPMLQIMAGPDGEDAFCRPIRFGAPERLDIAKLTVYVVAGVNMPGMGVTQSLLDAQERAASALERAGARVVRNHHIDLHDAVDIWATLLADAGGTTFGQHMVGDHAGERPAPPARRMFAACVAELLGLGPSQPHTFPAVGLALIERIQSLPILEYRKAGVRERARVLKEQLEALLGEFDEAEHVLKSPPQGDAIILFPPHTQPAARHCVPLFFPVQWVMTAIWNSMQLPATQVPLGHDADGIPVGVQVVGGEGGDHITIGVAMFLEKALGGWRHID